METRSAGVSTAVTADYSTDRANSAEPGSVSERALAEILAAILQVDRVQVGGHFFNDLGADSLVMAQFCARVRKRPDLPSVSMKDVYQYPSIAALATALMPAAPVNPARELLAEVLAAILQVDRVQVGGHFFNDLGADSLVMAQFCARVRKRPDLPSVSMKDVYQYPTIAALADALAPATALGPTGPEQSESSSPPPVEVAAPARTAQVILCGVLQLLIFLGYSYLAAFVTAQGFGWISAASGLIDTYLRAAFFGGALFVSICILPIVAKWVLIGRWKPQEIRIWSIRYVRFWTVKTMIRANPMAVFVGSPLYSLYLRLLGAKIGRGVSHSVQARAGMHRPVDHRVGHGHPQGGLLPGIPSARRSDSDRRGHPRPGCVHR